MVAAEALVFVQQYGILGVFITSIIFNASVLFPLPADLLVFTAGSLANDSLLFNPLLIGLAAGFAAALGELVAWAIGWGMHKHVLRKRVGKRYKKAIDAFERYGFWGIALFAFAPLPMDVIGLVAGALRYDGAKFFYAALVGKVPRCLLLSYAGYYGVQLVASVYQWGV
jgi:membrane protein DedA with SNARE-associated domain